MPENTLTSSQTRNFRYFFALFLCACVAFLIMAGGLVTSHDAGLAVPDWPLSYGQVFPPMVGNIFWEHGHRMIAGFTGILTLIMAVWTQFAEERKWFRRLAWAAFGTVVLQALLGGLTVLFLLPDAISIFHACLAQTFFCLTLAMAWFLSPEFLSPSFKPGLPEGLRRLSLITIALIFTQLILGAASRHTEYLLPVALHIAAAFGVAAFVFILVYTILHEEASGLLSNAAIGIGSLTVAQFFLGLGSFIFTRMVEQGYAPSRASVLFTVAHQTNGSWILALSVLIALRIFKK